jgi:hypothetical protein
MFNILPLVSTKYCDTTYMRRVFRITIPMAPGYPSPTHNTGLTWQEG